MVRGMIGNEARDFNRAKKRGKIERGAYGGPASPDAPDGVIRGERGKRGGFRISSDVDVKEEKKSADNRNDEE